MKLTPQQAAIAVLAARALDTVVKCANQRHLARELRRVICASREPETLVAFGTSAGTAIIGQTGFVGMLNAASGAAMLVPVASSPLERATFLWRYSPVEAAPSELVAYQRMEETGVMQAIRDHVRAAAEKGRQ
ncbi:hypothetical protein MHZ93_03990 [Roseomonas sp. ACRSG]|nr:hypothetical protein [Roseomonas sp. ACRSG]